MPEARQIIVIGGGITGLSAAWRLQQAFQKSAQPLQLLLLEASDRVGGTIQTEYRDGFTLELGPDCFISQKPRGLALVRELGLEGELIGTKPDDRRSFIYRNGQFHAVPEGFYLMGPSKLRPFLQSKLLSWPGKFRALMEPLQSNETHRDESLGSFVRRRLGQEMLDWLAQPLIGGIYGADPERLSLRATFPQFQEMEKKYGSVLLGLKKRGEATRQASGARYSLFVSMKRGLQTITDELDPRLGPTVVRRGVRVKSLRPQDNRWQVTLATGQTLMADEVVLALPTNACADLIRDFDVDLALNLEGILYAPAATINFAFRQIDIGKTFPGIGFVVPHKEKFSVMGCTNVQNKFDGRVPKGFVLLRAFIGGVLGAQWLNQNDEAMTAQALADLHHMLGFSAKPLFGRVARYSRALPQYELGHVEQVIKIQERALAYKGLRLAGNWLHGVGLPDCVESAEHTVNALV